MIKIVSAVFALVFISFAIVQLNDPDPVLWTAFYLFIAIVSLLRIFEKRYKKVVLVGMAVAAGIALFTGPGFIEWLGQPDKSEIFGEMVYKKSYIEETREFLGSLIGLAALTFLYVKS